ncbi:MAG: glycosyltransferase family 2 protein [Candidatus Sulfotelmatobacter sp.]
MTQSELDSTASPLFSIVVPVYNDWIPLDQCLQSLARQTNAPPFEVILVDDGSTVAAPEFIRSPAHSYPLTLIRQSHSGIPSARNQGIRASRGAVLLFVDADCRLQTNCLAALSSTIADSPQHDYFQLRIVGHRSNLVGRAEELRLITFQEHMIQTDGRIRYLNTAGFAMRRARADFDKGVFDPVALRAEDTLLLANLMQAGKLPLFVPEAIVEHEIPLSLIGCLRKDIRSVYLEGKAYDIIASKGVRIRVTHRERLRLLSAMWKTAGQPSIGRSAWVVLVARQALQRTISFCFRCLRIGSVTPA